MYFKKSRKKKEEREKEERERERGEDLSNGFSQNPLHGILVVTSNGRATAARATRAHTCTQRTEFSSGGQKRETSFSRNSGSRGEVPEMEFKMLLILTEKQQSK